MSWYNREICRTRLPFSNIMMVFSSVLKAALTTKWFLHGRKHFRESGYISHKQEYNSPVQGEAKIGRGVDGADGVDLGGRSIVITG